MNQNPGLLHLISLGHTSFPQEYQHFSYLRTLSRNEPTYLSPISIPLLSRHLLCFSRNYFNLCLYNHFLGPYNIGLLRF